MVRRPPGIELALLGFLQNGPQHGYQIHLILSDESGLGQIWNLKQSQLYALLAKLENDGYIEGELEMPVGAHPPRRMFHLTAKGITEYEQWVDSPVEIPRQMRQEFMAKLYFARQAGFERVRKLLDLQRTRCQQWIETYSLAKETQTDFVGLVHHYRRGQIQAMLDWLADIK